MNARPAALPAVLLIATAIASGCINPGTGTVQGKGVTIVDFGPEIDTVYSGEGNVRFMLKVKNTGSFRADIKDYKLSLLEDTDWACGPQPSLREVQLIPPDPQRGTEGEEAVVAWSCTAPTVPKGMEIPYEPRAEVTYDYQSVTSKSVTVLSRSELISLRNSGKPLPSETVSVSGSPIDMDIQVEGPIRLGSGDMHMDFPVTVRIANVGGGILEGNMLTSIVVEGSGAVKSISDCDKTNLPLWKGQSQTLTCTARASTTDITQSMIVATAVYKYTVSAGTRITVMGDKAVV